MSRMRLMETGGAGASALVCLYCGAEAESRPPYAVTYCYCRSTPSECGVGSAGPRSGPPPAALAA